MRNHLPVFNPAYMPVCVLLLLAILLPGACTAADSLQLLPGTTIELADAKTGETLLGTTDAYLKRMSAFDREARMHVTETPTLDAFAAHCAKHVRAFTDEDLALLRSTIKKVGTALQPLAVPFPAHITLVKTDGLEDVGFPYCRGTTIILPDLALHKDPLAFERMFTHELFHVFSTAHPGKRAAFYALLGFLPCQELQLLPMQDRRRFTNPDAMNYDFYLPLSVGDQTIIKVIPLLVAKEDHYDGKSDLFETVDFVLAEVDPGDHPTWPVLNADNHATLRAPDVAYIRQMSQNTDYIWHPEEVLADNFVHAVFPSKTLKNPDLPWRLLEVMRGGK